METTALCSHRYVNLEPTVLHGDIHTFALVCRPHTTKTSSLPPNVLAVHSAGHLDEPDALAPYLDLLSAAAAADVT